MLHGSDKAIEQPHLNAQQPSCIQSLPALLENSTDLAHVNSLVLVGWFSPSSCFQVWLCYLKYVSSRIFCFVVFYFAWEVLFVCLF